MHAGYRLGAIPVPVKYRLAASEIKAIFKDANCGLIAVEEFFDDFVADGCLDHLSDHIVWIPSGGKQQGASDYEEELQAARPAPMREASEDDDALLLLASRSWDTAGGLPHWLRWEFGSTAE